MNTGDEEWLGFPDLRSGQKPWWNWYLTPVVNFSEIRKVQFVKSTLLTSTSMPWDLFRSFKVGSDVKERVGVRKAMGSYRTYSIPRKTAALVREFAMVNLLRLNCSVCSCACSKWPALGKNTLMMIMKTKIWKILKMDKIQYELECCKIRKFKRINNGMTPRRALEYRLG